MIDVDTVKARNPVEQVIGSFTRLVREGRNYRGACPVHGGDGQNLVVYPESGTWHCFSRGCDDDGNDVIAFVEKMQGLNFAEACDVLGAHREWKPQLEKPPKPPLPDRITSKPPPDAGKPDMRIQRLGEPSRVWEYRDTDGRTFGYVARYETDNGKEIRVWTFGTRGAAAPEWGCGSWSKPRPLYHLDALANRLNAPAVLTEGEKACDAAQALLPTYIAVTWPGGAQAWRFADWEPLRGRRVLLWPDADEPGMNAMQGLAEVLADPGGLGCKVRIIDPSGMPEGFDAADWTGSTEELIAWARPRASDFSYTVTQLGKETKAQAVAGAIELPIGKTTPGASGDPASPKPLTPEPGGALLEADVTDVTDVQASNGAASNVTPDAAVDVTGVTNEGEAIPDAEHRPAFRVFNDWVSLPDGGKLRPGVWFFGIRAGKKADDAPALIQQWISSPLHIEAVTFDGQENNFGRLLKFRTTIKKWREWAMPMELLRGAGDELRGELLAMGVEIDPHSGRNLLGQYLQSKPPKRRMRCALQVGWCDDSFVLPDTVIGPGASGVIFQSGERGYDEHTRGGTPAGWQSDIAARAVGNPLLTLALSASFAGPMLRLCNGESGGIHFVGDSSTGKTTAIEAACATWGGTNFRRSWRATANGMEGAAALFNDCLLALDEISECDPREVGAIVYALGNGRGKQRASRTGNARGVTRWRVMVLSSGERTIGTTMAEGGYRAKAGQSVRLLDIPAARRFGAWDELHGLPNGAAFADAIRRAAVAHHGHAGRAFLEKLTRDGRDFCELLEHFKALPEFSTGAGEGQDKRTAGRFALLALAGEVATEYGITGWPEGSAIEAAMEGLAAWRSMRGRGNDERRQILERVSGFIERHGDSRFSNADAYPSDDVIRFNRAGWWRDDGDGRVYLFNAEGMREAVKGFDFRRALDALQEAGALPEADTSGERAKAQRIAGRLVRVYPIRPDKLGANHGA